MKQTKKERLGTEVINTARKYIGKNYEKLQELELGFELGLRLEQGWGLKMNWC